MGNVWICHWWLSAGRTARKYLVGAHWLFYHFLTPTIWLSHGHLKCLRFWAPMKDAHHTDPYALNVFGETKCAALVRWNENLGYAVDSVTMLQPDETARPTTNHCKSDRWENFRLEGNLLRITKRLWMRWNRFYGIKIYKLDKLCFGWFLCSFCLWTCFLI